MPASDSQPVPELGDPPAALDLSAATSDERSSPDLGPWEDLATPLSPATDSTASPDPSTALGPIWGVQDASVRDAPAQHAPHDRSPVLVLLLLDSTPDVTVWDTPDLIAGDYPDLTPQCPVSEALHIPAPGVRADPPSALDSPSLPSDLGLALGPALGPGGLACLSLGTVAARPYLLYWGTARPCGGTPPRLLSAAGACLSWGVAAAGPALLPGHGGTPGPPLWGSPPST